MYEADMISGVQGQTEIDAPIMLCATFSFWHRLNAGHAANLIQPVQNHTELQHLGKISKKY